jgi:Uri superfamily endonuclease
MEAGIRGTREKCCQFVGHCNSPVWDFFYNFVRRVNVGTARQRLTANPGTYALVLELSTASKLRIGSLGTRTFEPSVYFYSGSAFGSGGLFGRLKHHLALSPRPHWHIDYLRCVAAVVQVWTTCDSRRLECAWSAAARSLRGSTEVPGFGASDCGCTSHLVKLARFPRPSRFRRHLRLSPTCKPISVFRLNASAA